MAMRLKRMNRFKAFVKREAMFVIAISVALIALILTGFPKEAFLNINWKTLVSLFMLITCLEGFKQERMLDPISRYATRIRNPYVLSIFLVVIIFILSAFITNDVALLAFVPITMTIFKKTEREKYIIPVVAIETIAANLGSMLTPFGNPQNLFLYSRMNLSGWDFVATMAPLSAISLGLLILALTFTFRKDFKDELVIQVNEEHEPIRKNMGMFYFCLFLFTLFGILGNIHWLTMLIFFMLLICFFDSKILRKIDWYLLSTFLAFFVFSTAISSNGTIMSFLYPIVANNEISAGFVLSQLISNVPATIVLEPFAENLRNLLFGVNVGGLGTLVASLASLISFRLYSKQEKENKGRYIATFTIWNIVFIAILLPISFFI